MAAPTVVFISGVRQGIGRSLLERYLLLPNHIVIGTVRNPDTNSNLQALPTATGSRSLLVSIENANPDDYATALATITSEGINHIDVLIANARGSPPLKSIDDVPPEHLASAYAVNTSSALLYFQTFKPLLQAAAQPKWVSVSTAASSLALMGEIGTYVAPAYGASKAALNWLTLRVFGDKNPHTSTGGRHAYGGTFERLQSRLALDLRVDDSRSALRARTVLVKYI
ncbi:uncharacterized protein DSM5745_10241 [Aspergillus mulundensis]|uniref:Uncharacterized protein n=1 Tax=Aspergillus mulundensis TaxID=1810919 RepID=A0A3D8QNA2_9EURO|nr:hypothetical protein DSM5745_10241 [Aspergillus mulundensis]RDW63130.1 hypothetical protein DSM5745_10241 [Aspergillus mulundensis]